MLLILLVQVGNITLTTRQKGKNSENIQNTIDLA